MGAGGVSLATLRKRFAVPTGGEALNSGQLKAKLGEALLKRGLLGERRRRWKQAALWHGRR